MEPKERYIARFYPPPRPVCRGTRTVNRDNQGGSDIPTGLIKMTKNAPTQANFAENAC